MVECIYECDEIKVLDGGFGTQISKRLGKSIDDDALWSSRLLATNKDEVINTHLEFLKAGSDVIETNTYQASIIGFQKYLNLSESESYDLIKVAVNLAKSARELFMLEYPHRKLPLIAGSVGPYGASLHDGSEYTGSYKDHVTEDFLYSWHKQKINALVDGGVDILAFETLPCKIEAEVLLNILKEFPDIKAWLSFNCKDGKCLASGESFTETTNYCYNLNPNQILAVGANCISPFYVEELFKDINNGRSVPMPLIVYPNSGEVYNQKDGWIGRDECPPIESFVPKWLNMGIRWIGGCCRTYDTDIACIRRQVDNWKK